ncbi:unnamed protein product [Closterium sp. NIES-54]
MRKLLRGMRLPNHQWPEAMDHGVKLHNLLSSSSLPNNASPHLLWTGKQGSTKMLRVFGCMVQYQPPSARAGRFSQRAQWGLHRGIERNYNAWKIFDVHSKETVAARDVIFYERLTLPTYLANLEEDRDPTGGFRGDRHFASAADEADWDEQNVDNASEEAGPLPYCSMPIPMDNENLRESINAETYFEFADTGRGKRDLSQRCKVRRTIAKRFSLTPTTISTPYRYSAGNNKAESAPLKPASICNYQRKMGCLLFAAVTCRPDLSYSASQLATYLKRPEAEHMAELDRALHYLDEIEKGRLELSYCPTSEMAADYLTKKLGKSNRAAGAGGPPVAPGPGGARTGGTGAVGTGGVAAATGVGPAGASRAAGAGATGGVGTGVGTAGASGAAGAGATEGVGAGVGYAGGTAGAAGGTGAVGPAGVGAVGAGGADDTGAANGGTGAVPVGTADPARPRPYFVPLLEQVLGLPPSPGPAPPLECSQPVQSQSQLQPVSPLPTPSPYAGPTGGLAKSREPASRPASPIRTARTSRRAPRPRPPAVPGTHQMTLRPSTSPLRVLLPSPPESSIPVLADPASDSLRAASPSVARLLSTVVTDPSFASTAALALLAELVDFAACCRLDYAASLVAESASVCPLSVGGECALSTDVLEDRQEEFQCFAAALPHLVSTLIAPEGDPDAPDIPTPRSYAEAIEGPYSSQWQSAMDAEMASWMSTSTYDDEVPPPGANIVSGMWIFRVKRPPGSPPVFRARYVARGFSQRQGVDYFQTFSPTPEMTTLRVLLHVAAQRDYELHSLDFSTAFQQGSLHEEIWLRRPPGFTGSFPPGTHLHRPVYDLRQAPREWHDTLRTTLAALGFAPPTADPSLFLRTDTSLPPFYILVYVDDLVFATAYTAGLAHMKSELQKRHTCTDLGELRSYLGLQITRDRARRTITLTQSHMVQQVLQRFDFTYSSPQATPLSTRHSLSALPSDEWVQTRAHREDVEPEVHPISLGSGSVSWRSTRSSSVLGSSCEAEIYAGAMAAQELRWLTYLLTDLGEPPRSPPVLYVDNKAMLALCREHRLEHRTKHIALRYFLARELQQRGQLRLAYVASEANTSDIFTKALPPGDHQRLCTMLGFPTLATPCLSADLQLWLVLAARPFVLLVPRVTAFQHSRLLPLQPLRLLPLLHPHLLALISRGCCPCSSPSRWPCCALGCCPDPPLAAGPAAPPATASAASPAAVPAGCRVAVPVGLLIAGQDFPPTSPPAGQPTVAPAAPLDVASGAPARFLSTALGGPLVAGPLAVALVAPLATAYATPQGAALASPLAAGSTAPLAVVPVVPLPAVPAVPLTAVPAAPLSALPVGLQPATPAVVLTMDPIDAIVAVPGRLPPWAWPHRPCDAPAAPRTSGLPDFHPAVAPAVHQTATPGGHQATAPADHQAAALAGHQAAASAGNQATVPAGHPAAASAGHLVVAPASRPADATPGGLLRAAPTDP